MCCGNKRAALNSRLQSLDTLTPDLAAIYRRRAASTTVRLRYIGGEALSLAGPVTGQTYAVPGANSEVAVDQRDVNAFLCTHLFEFA